ncbi:MAG: 4-(cytidine 5'-diphospho)-2-C-methyl-D-erythritol kinase [Salinivirgaceae bacterium]|nr:4-(cytidine 5'-diphospho)-2-C-methyl-D-erythritol kinase [Salinivirgaceae bacterium]
MIVRPNAKINIGLNIVEKRPDGFHNLESLMVPFGLTDELKLTENKRIGAKKFELVIDGLPVDGSLDTNLVSRAYHLINADYSLPPVRAVLKKQIPMGAGLGGGSADCAFTITALNKLFDLKLSVDAMQRYASMLGSDCALFVQNKPAFATSRGEILKPVNVNLSGYSIVIVKPNVHVNTAQAYKLLTPHRPETPITELIDKKPEEWRGKMVNDFEAPIFEMHPILNDIKTALYNAGAAYASMSGSGSAIYGLFKQMPDDECFKFDGCFIWKGKFK